jgi:hypothetical protein
VGGVEHGDPAGAVVEQHGAPVVHDDVARLLGGVGDVGEPRLGGPVVVAGLRRVKPSIPMWSDGAADVRTVLKNTAAHRAPEAAPR